MTRCAELDPFDVAPRARAPGLLREFNDAGVLAAADVHVALRLARARPARTTRRSRSPPRSPSAGRGSATSTSTSRRSARPRRSTTEEPVDLSALPWPEAGDWIARAAAQPARRGRRGRRRRAARCASSARWLYLDRYWREERQVAADLRGARRRAGRRRRRRRCSRRASTRLFARRDRPAASASPRRPRSCAGSRSSPAARARARRRRSRGSSRCSPSRPRRPARRPARRARRADRQGRGAARGGGARARRPTLDVDAAIREQPARPAAPRRCTGCSAGGPDSHSRFRHDRGNRLPHDVVIVDETSMVSLSLMARLVEAVRPDARLDPRRRPRPARPRSRPARCSATSSARRRLMHERGSWRSSGSTGYGRRRSPRRRRRRRSSCRGDRSERHRRSPTRSARRRRATSTWHRRPTSDLDPDDAGDARAAAPATARSTPRARSSRPPAPATPRRDRGARRLPPPVRPPPRRPRRRHLDGPDRGLARRPRSPASAPRAAGTPAARCS